MRSSALRLWILAGLILTACQTVSPAGNAAFRDDFNNPQSGWSTTDTKEVRIAYQSGALHFVIRVLDSAAWSVAGQQFRDFSLDVDATQVDGPDNNHYGVIVRYADDKNFYRLDISGDGYYSIQRYQDGKWNVLINWPESPAIKQGATTNHLRVTAQGPKLTLAVNGMTVASIDNANILAGDVGLTAGTFSDQAGVHIAFDNFEVKPLEKPTP